MKNLAYLLLILCLLGLPKIAKCNLPREIRIAAIFDQDGDRKHELAFRYGVDRINMQREILQGKQLQAEIIRIPTGNR